MVMKKVLLRILIIALIFNFIFTQKYRIIKLDGDSMAETLHDSDINLLNYTYYNYNIPDRFDIVCAKVVDESENGNSEPFTVIKRILGMPGEKIYVNDGVFYINDVKLEDPFFVYSHQFNLDSFLLGNDEYFIIGDNRSISSYYIVNIKNRQNNYILGKVLF